MSIKIINQIFWSLFFLTIWFKTEAFIEYSKLFRLDGIFKIDNYELYKKINHSIQYLDFLSLKYPNFLTKLISCPFCINFWICIGLSYDNLLFFPIVYIASITIFNCLERTIYGRK
jgi:hypothetical protein